MPIRAPIPNHSPQLLLLLQSVAWMLHAERSEVLL
jgi:hypothetical protein